VTDVQHRRRSIFPGLLLIVLGLIFLLHRLDPALGIGHLIRIYWPFVFILWGIAKLIDHVAAQNAGQVRPPLLSGAEAALLILLAFVLIAFGLRDWLHGRFPEIDIEDAPFQQSFSQSRQLPVQAIPDGAHISIETARGSITVHGSDAHDLRVSVNESSHGENESAADARMKDVEVVIERNGDAYNIHPIHQADFSGGVTADLDVEVPKTAILVLHTSHGDINVSSIGGLVDARTDNGNIEIHDATANVFAQVHVGDARITGVGGNVRLEARGRDVEIADVVGDVTVDGPVVGSTVVRKAGKTTRVTSPWSDLTFEHLNGRLETDSGDIQVSDVAGPARIQTHNKDVTAENVAGQLDIISSHGDVKVVYSTPPVAPLNITNDSGEVDLTLPGRSSFQISAFSRSGDVDSEFEDPSLKTTGEEKDGRLDGQYGSKSGAPVPRITITTSYGTISLHKSS
jgi:DUF4097 and DUF4098 domain-containing protein YvlB